MSFSCAVGESGHYCIHAPTSWRINNLCAPATIAALAVESATAMGLKEKLSAAWMALGRGGGQVRATVLVLGLDGAGKSSVLTALRPREEHSQQQQQHGAGSGGDTGAQPQPTVAAQQHQFTSGGVSISWCDVSGLARHRPLWERHYRRADAIVFVVDAADHLRLVVAREELQLALAHPALASRRLPLLVLANKSDQPDALPITSIASALGLECVRDKPWHVVSASAVSGAGLDSGVAWLARQLRDQMTRRHSHH